jgi:hypothetical protein
MDTVMKQGLLSGKPLSASTARKLKLLAILLVLIGIFIAGAYVALIVFPGESVPAVTLQNVYLDIDGDGIPDYVRSVRFVPTSGIGSPLP